MIVDQYFSIKSIKATITDIRVSINHSGFDMVLKEVDYVVRVTDVQGREIKEIDYTVKVNLRVRQVIMLPVEVVLWADLISYNTAGELSLVESLMNLDRAVLGQ